MSNPQPGGPGPIFITPGTRWPSYTPRHCVPILVTFYDMYGLQWDYSLFPVTTQDHYFIIWLFNGYSEIFLTGINTELIKKKWVKCRTSLYLFFVCLTSSSIPYTPSWDIGQLKISSSGKIHFTFM